MLTTKRQVNPKMSENVGFWGSIVNPNGLPKTEQKVSILGLRVNRKPKAEMTKNDQK